MQRNQIARYNGNPYAYTVLQNLKDAGCPAEMIQQVVSLQENGEGKKMVELLTEHRKHLLDLVHKEEKKIDCLDYLIYCIENKCLNI